MVSYDNYGTVLLIKCDCMCVCILDFRLIREAGDESYKIKTFTRLCPSSYVEWNNYIIASFQYKFHKSYLYYKILYL